VRTLNPAYHENTLERLQCVLCVCERIVKSDKFRRIMVFIHRCQSWLCAPCVSTYIFSDKSYRHMNRPEARSGAYIVNENKTKTEFVSYSIVLYCHE
jgi:hypothetical protein